MKCPICRGLLEVTGQERLETLDEHVCNPNGEISMKDVYQCVNKDCIAKHDGLVWNSEGDLYSYNVKGHKEYPFIDNNDGPFGSYMRKARVEIYKKDENFYLFKSKKFDIEVKWIYKSDDDGNILSKRPSFWMWKSDKRGIGKTSWDFPWSSFFYKLKTFKHQRRFSKNNDLKEFFFPNNWNKDHFWVKLSASYLKIRHPFIYQRVK